MKAIDLVMVPHLAFLDARRSSACVRSSRRRMFALGLGLWVLTACGNDRTSTPNDDGGVTIDASSVDDATVFDGGGTDDSATPEPGAGDTCATAFPIGAGLREGDTTSGYSADYTSSSTCTGLGGADRVYAITIPAGHQLEATVTPVADFDVSIGLILEGAESCTSDGVPCSRSHDGGGDGDAEALTYSNQSGDDLQALLLVSTFWSERSGAYTLDVQFHPPNAGDDCALATPISTGALVGQTTDGFRNDFQADSDECGSLGGGPDRVYSITVPSQQRLLVHATPDAAAYYDLSLYLVHGAPDVCSRGAGCVSHVDEGSDGEGETTSYFNGSDVPTEIYIVVDGVSSDDAGAFVLETELSPPVDGDMCSSALMIIPGELLGQSFDGFANDYDGGDDCAIAPGQDRVYAIDVPPGQVLLAAVTPESSLDVTVSIAESLEACDGAAHVCATHRDSGAHGDAESVRYANVSTAFQTVYVIVDTYDGSGNFMLTTSLVE